jgi:hypothetical protein
LLVGDPTAAETTRPKKDRRCSVPRFRDARFTSLLGQQSERSRDPFLEKYRLAPAGALGHAMRKAGKHQRAKARHVSDLAFFEPLFVP